jgi:ElaB/YqjD/DUF883 family membrane-anchored ribosome-binding protein
MNDQSDDTAVRADARAQELAGLAVRYAAIAGGRIAEEKERLKEYVSREPLRALGIAFGVGVLIGWWTKRR